MGTGSHDSQTVSGFGQLLEERFDAVKEADQMNVSGFIFQPESECLGRIPDLQLSQRDKGSASQNKSQFIDLAVNSVCLGKCVFQGL